MKLLIIEDEIDIANSISDYFKKTGYVCERASTFAKAIEKIYVYDYDCIILDITLPDGNGLKILSDLKKQNIKTGVIILSAKNSLDDKLNGLNIGADDYLTKPFHLSELLARVNAIIRRKYFNADSEIILGNIKISPDKKSAFINNQEGDFTRKEYELLLFFIINRDRVIETSSLSEHVWGDSIDQSDSFDFIYSQIKNLRKKLNHSGAEYSIKSVYGVGYKFVKNEITE